MPTQSAPGKAWPAPCFHWARRRGWKELCGQECSEKASAWKPLQASQSRAAPSLRTGQDSAQQQLRLAEIWCGVCKGSWGCLSSQPPASDLHSLERWGGGLGQRCAPLARFSSVRGSKALRGGTGPPETRAVHLLQAQGQEIGGGAPESKAESKSKSFPLGCQTAHKLGRSPEFFLGLL